MRYLACVMFMACGPSYTQDQLAASDMLSALTDRWWTFLKQDDNLYLHQDIGNPSGWAYVDYYGGPYEDLQSNAYLGYWEYEGDGHFTGYHPDKGSWGITVSPSDLEGCWTVKVLIYSDTACLYKGE